MDNIKKRWEGDIIVNHGTIKSCGVATLIKGDRLNSVKQVYKDGKGRLLVTEFVFQNELFRLINIYAPNIEIERKEVFKEIKTLCKGNFIVVGDFNVWCTRLDASSSANFKSDASRKFLIEWMQNEDIVDVWRDENPYKKDFSRRQLVMGVLKQSRIDLCLAKREMLKYVKNVKYKFVGVSDHAMMKVKMGVNEVERGGGMWALNADLLKEEAYKESIRKCIVYEMENVLFDENVCVWWEKMKGIIKKRSIRYAKQRDFRRRCNFEAMENELKREAGKIESNQEGFVRLKTELEEYKKEKSKGAIIRSRAQYALEGERSTKFFLNLENKKQRRKHIVELENGKGEKINDFVGIIEEVENFYKELFKKEGVKQECVDEVLSTVNVKLDEDEKNMCERDIDIEEIKSAINQTKKNKSPGSDGLTHEFYKTFIGTLAPILLKVYKSMEERREVPESMGLGVITILYKNKGSPLSLGNYRPLSLLNTDYKILTKVLTNRIKEVVGNIISQNQAYSIPGRDITDTICTIRDVVDSLDKDGEGGIVLCIDLNKAFDRVEHSFIEQTMRRFGFGERILRWISLLYNNAKSCVKVNGVLTDSFPLERSVRQGCPLSALLYSITAEPLATLIKKDKEIRGIPIPHGRMSLIHQYADDTTFTVRDIESINKIMKHMETYGKASGAKINIDKSEIMSIGGVDIGRCDIPFKVTNDHMRILGVNIGVNAKEARDATWTGILNKMKQVLQFWRLRDLRLRGKVVVANSLVISKCNYVIGAVDLPDWVLNEMKEVVNNFLWGGKGVKISTKTLIADYTAGGLKLIDIDVKRKSIRVKMIKKYLYDKVDCGWKGFLRDFLDKSGGCGEEGVFLALKKPMVEKIPLFYQEVFSAWAEFLVNIRYECENINQIHNQPIFLNPKIRMKGKMFYNRLYMKAGIRQVKDIVYEYVRGFLPNRAIYDCVVGWDEDIEKSKVDCVCENIKASLPRSWVERIEKEVMKVGNWGIPDMYIVKNDERKHLAVVTMKEIYRMLVEKEIKLPASESVWPKVFPDLNVKAIWKNLSVKYNGLDCENLDFKLRHNRIYTKVVIHQINRNVNRECDVCKTDPETLMHIFFECKELDVFHEKLKKIIKGNWGKDVTGNEWKKLFLFGESTNCKDVGVSLCNFILSHARYAIWARRNLAYFERKKVDVAVMFKSVVRKNVYLMWKYLSKDTFEKAFINGCSLIRVDDKEGLSVKF
ncbi:hypothetical protein PO909_022110 [Leuciscus waleckii]